MVLRQVANCGSKCGLPLWSAAWPGRRWTEHILSPQNSPWGFQVAYNANMSTVRNGWASHERTAPSLDQTRADATSHRGLVFSEQQLGDALISSRLLPVHHRMAATSQGIMSVQPGETGRSSLAVSAAFHPGGKVQNFLRRLPSRSEPP